MKLTIIYKLSLSAVLLVLISVGIIGGLFYNKTTDLLVQHALENIAAEISEAGTQLQTHIDHQRRDTLFIASTPPIQGMLRALKNNNYDKKGKSTYRQWEKRVQKIFIAILKSKPSYQQIRFLNHKGQELIDVHHESKSDEFHIHSKERLQDKSKSAYVKDTIKLAVGSVYLSEINLNREHGEVSKPHTEVLRSATPVYDEQTGKIAGLVVVNVEIGRELRKIHKHIQDKKSGETI